MISIPTHQLDQESLAYLNRIGQTNGAASNGAFIRRDGTYTSPRLGQFLLLVVGFLLIAATFLTYNYIDFRSADYQTV